MTINTKIQVNPEKLEILKLLQLRDVFSTDPDEMKIRRIQRKHLNTNLARRWDEQHPTIVIIPTALIFGLKERQPYKNAQNIHIIPYSEHSSYSELLTFVGKLKPKRLIPIAMYGRGIFGKDCKDRLNFEAFDKLLDERPRMDFVVPRSVQEFMNVRGCIKYQSAFETFLEEKPKRDHSVPNQEASTLPRKLRRK